MSWLLHRRRSGGGRLSMQRSRQPTRLGHLAASALRGWRRPSAGYYTAVWQKLVANRLWRKLAGVFWRLSSAGSIYYLSVCVSMLANHCGLSLFNVSFNGLSAVAMHKWLCVWLSYLDSASSIRHILFLNMAENEREISVS